MFSLSQYTAARTSAMMIDRSALGTIALTGADRRTFLHALLTNDIAGLTPGKGTYAGILVAALQANAVDGNPVVGAIDSDGDRGFRGD
jgi:hypothetical protein